MTAQTADQLTLSDVALLARVQRPVVTTWRARHAASPCPFPAPSRTRGGQELFDCDKVVMWLEDTGRGNSPSVRADAVAFTMTSDEVATDPTAFAGLSALLCLYVVSGHLPDGADDVLDLADECDSDDVMLFREVAALGDRLAPLAHYATLLAGASFNPSEPFEQLVRLHARANGRPLRRLSAELCGLVASTALGVADQAGFSEPVFVVPSADDVELVLEVSTQAEDRGAVLASVPADDEATRRLARRRLRVHDIACVDLPGDGSGGFRLPDQAVILMQLPGDVDAVDALATASDMSVSLTERHRAVLVGPAPAMTNALRLPGQGPGRPPADDTRLSPAALVRRDVIKTGLLRAVVRLPRGGLLDQPRSRSALWCLGPVSSPSTSAQHVLTADISLPLTPSTRDDLVTDLVAAMTGPPAQRVHLPSYGQFIRSSDLQMSAGDLVTPRTPSQASLLVDETMEDVRRLASDLSAPSPEFTRPRLVATAGHGRPATITLGDAVRSGGLRWNPGARVSASDLIADGGIPVIVDPRELSPGGPAPATLDRLLHVTRYPHSELSQPGDIIVTMAPRPQARVDYQGGVLVAHPARVLRCHRPTPVSQDLEDPAPTPGKAKKVTPQTFVPEAVAADINALPATAKTWKAWPVHVVPLDEIAPLSLLLDELANHRRRAEQRIVDLHQLTAVLTRGISSSICTLSLTEGP